MKIYVASSWRNPRHDSVVKVLIEHGHKVYNYRTADGAKGFSWADIDPNWKNLTIEQYRKHSRHLAARTGFLLDYSAMQAADACVLVEPSGKSSHMEAGWFAGCGLKVIVLLAEGEEPELMYHLADYICESVDEVCDVLKALTSFNAQARCITIKHEIDPREFLIPKVFD